MERLPLQLARALGPEPGTCYQDLAAGVHARVQTVQPPHLHAAQAAVDSAMLRPSLTHTNLCTVAVIAKKGWPRCPYPHAAQPHASGWLVQQSSMPSTSARNGYTRLSQQTGTRACVCLHLYMRLCPLPWALGPVRGEQCQARVKLITWFIPPAREGCIVNKRVHMQQVPDGGVEVGPIGQPQCKNAPFNSPMRQLPYTIASRHGTQKPQRTCADMHACACTALSASYTLPIFQQGANSS